MHHAERLRRGAGLRVEQVHVTALDGGGEAAASMRDRMAWQVDRGGGGAGELCRGTTRFAARSVNRGRNHGCAASRSENNSYAARKVYFAHS